VAGESAELRAQSKTKRNSKEHSAQRKALGSEVCVQGYEEKGAGYWVQGTGYWVLGAGC